MVNLKTNFYISSNQSSGNANLTPETDANYFCKSIYGFNFKSFCYDIGDYKISGKMGHQVHRNSDRTSYLGSNITNSNCNGGRCKIWKTDSNNDGIYDIMCQGNFYNLNS